MARQKFGWFKLYSDILENPKLERLSGDAAFVYIRILCALNRADSKDGKLSITDSGLCRLARRKRTDSALVTIRKLAAVGLVDLHYASGHGLLTVPNWVESQGFRVPPKTETRQRQKQDNKVQEQAPQSSPKTPSKPPRPTSKRREAIPFPDPFPAHGREQVRKALGRFGFHDHSAVIDYAIGKTRGAHEQAEGTKLASAQLRTERGWIKWVTNAIGKGYAVDQALIVAT